MKNYGMIARENFKKGYNCAQAVACAFAEEMGMSEETCARLVSSFGGGMGKLREVCGAVSGALFVLGAMKGYSDPKADTEKSAHYKRVQDFAATFRSEHETIICRELLKNVALKKENTHEPEARTDDYYRVRPCVAFVETAANVVAHMLAE